MTLVLPPRRERTRRGQKAQGENPIDDPMFEALRACRRALAQEAGVPPYVIFHDSTLREMAAARPTSRDGLSEISGVGARKLDAYGDRFIETIRAFEG